MVREPADTPRTATSTCSWRTPTRRGPRWCAAGFRPTGDPDLYVGIHHLRPLVWPGLPMAVEVHHEPKWVDFAEPPVRELLATAVPSSTRPPGPPDARAGATRCRPRGARLGAHPARPARPAHRRRRRLRGSRPRGPRHRGERLGGRTALADDPGRDRRALCEAATTAGRAPLGTSPLERPRAHRHRTAPRALVRSVQRASPARAVRTTRSHIAQELAPAPGESRREKARRSGRAVANAFKRQSEHDEDETRATERETTR